MADIAEGGSLVLSELVVCQDGRVALDHGVELIEEEDGALLLIGTVGQASLIHGEIEDGVIDRAKDPAANTALCGVPLRIIG
jgi:hypothetical protein